MKAFDRLQLIIAKRDHSVKELTDKLSRHHEMDEINDAIALADEYGWMKKPEDLAEAWKRVATRKKRGNLWLKNEMIKKGLPTHKMDPEEEIAVARELVLGKFGEAPWEQKVQGRIARFLTSRGFNFSIVSDIIFRK